MCDRTPGWFFLIFFKFFKFFYILRFEAESVTVQIRRNFVFIVLRTVDRRVVVAFEHMP